MDYCKPYVDGWVVSPPLYYTNNEEQPKDYFFTASGVIFLDVSFETNFPMASLRSLYHENLQVPPNATPL